MGVDSERLFVQYNGVAMTQRRYDMETIKIMFTRPARATQPGGIILRKSRDGGYVTHRFNRIPHTRQPSEFFWGHYFHGDDALEKATADYDIRVATVLENPIDEGELIAKGDETLQP